MKCLDRTAKKIMDTLADACHVPIRDVCVLNHDDNYSKTYVHGSSALSQHVYNVIMKTWGVPEENITIKESPEFWWPLGSRGYIIEIKYENS